MSTTVCSYVDRHTGKEVQVGDSLLRRNYKGYKIRYEILGFEQNRVQVRKLDPSDRWIFLNMHPNALRLEEKR